MATYNTPVNRKKFTELVVSMFSTSDRLDRYTGTPDLTVFRTGIPAHVHAFLDGDIVEVTVYGDNYVDGVRIAVSNLDGSPSSVGTAAAMYTPVTSGQVRWVSEVLAQLMRLIGDPINPDNTEDVPDDTEDVPDDTEKYPLEVGQSVQELLTPDVDRLPIGAVIENRYGQEWTRTKYGLEEIGLESEDGVITHHLYMCPPYTRVG